MTLDDTKWEGSSLPQDTRSALTLRPPACTSPCWPGFYRQPIENDIIDGTDWIDSLWKILHRANLSNSHRTSRCFDSTSRNVSRVTLIHLMIRSRIQTKILYTIYDILECRGYTESICPGLINDILQEIKDKNSVCYRSKSITRSFALRGSLVRYRRARGIEVLTTGILENFLTLHLSNIKEQNTIWSASADGKIGFISADDIADLAVRTLTDEKSHNTDHILTGPELLSYDDVAAIFTDVLGRKITHTRITIEELKKRYLAFGLPEDYAEMLSSLDDLNANGIEEKIFAAEKKVTGKRTLKSFVEANKDSF